MSNNHIKSEDIELKNVVNGILSKELLSDDMGFKIRFFKLESNAVLPFHSHSAREYDYVLEGVISDETGEYKKGDLVVNEKGSEHSITAGPDGGEFLVLWIE